MFARRVFAALMLAGTALLGAATPALAHTELKGSDPAKGASIAVAPQQIQLTFSEPVQVPAGSITVAGPAGAQWTVGPATVAGAVVTAPVVPTGPAGAYSIAYRVISADGDPVSGTVKFTLTAPVPPPVTTTTTITTSTPTATSTPSATTEQTLPQPTPAAQQTDDGGIPLWIWIVGAIILLGIGVTVGMRTARSKPPAE